MHAEDDAWFMLCVCTSIVLTIYVSSNVIHLLEPVHCEHAIHIDDALRTLRSGDLLLLSYGDVKGDVARFLCGSWYNHVAVVVEDARARKFVWETDGSGTHMTPLTHSVLPLGVGESLVVRLLDRRVDRARMWAFANRHRNQPYHDDYWICAYKRWFPYMPLHWNRSRNQFCSMMVARMLHHLGVIPEQEDLLPCHFERLVTTDRFSYSPPIYILPTA